MKKRLFIMGMVLMMLAGLICPLHTNAKEPTVSESFSPEKSFQRIGGGAIASPMWSNVSEGFCTISSSSVSIQATLFISPKISTLHTYGRFYIERYSGGVWVPIGSVYIAQSGIIKRDLSQTGVFGTKYRSRFIGVTGGESVDIISSEIWL